MYEYDHTSKEILRAGGCENGHYSFTDPLCIINKKISPYRPCIKQWLQHKVSQKNPTIEINALFEFECPKCMNDYASRYFSLFKIWF